MNKNNFNKISEITKFTKIFAMLNKQKISWFFKNLNFY